MQSNVNKYIFHIGKWSIVVARWALVAGLVFTTLLSLLFIVARLWLPGLVERKSDLELILSQNTSYSVKIETMGTYWDGVFPGVLLKNVRLIEPLRNKSIIEVPQVKASLALMPLLTGSLELRELGLVESRFDLVREKSGRLVLNGIPLGSGKTNKDVDPQTAIDWLGKLHNVVIEGAQFSWLDLKTVDKKYSVKDVSVIMRNARNHHHISIAGKFPSDICTACYLTADLDGELLNPKDRRVQLNLHTLNLQPVSLPLIVRQYLPKGLRGKLHTLIRLDLEDKKLSLAQGYLSVNNLVWPIKGWKKPFTIKQLSGNVLWESGDDRWNLELAKLKLGLRKATSNAGRFTASYSPEKSAFSVKKLDLEDVAKFIEDLPVPPDLKEVVSAMKPAGTASNVRYGFSGPVTDRKNSTLSAGLDNLKISPNGRLPGLTNFSGKLRWSETGGELDIDSDEFTLDLPKIFRWPIDIRRFVGTVSWAAQEKSWIIDAPRLQVFSEDVVADSNVQVRIPYNRNITPYVKVNTRFLDGKVGSAKKFYPKNIMSKQLISWLDQSIAGGSVSSGELVIDGPIKSFPFSQGNGTFKVLVHLEDCTLDYLPDWPKLENINTVLLFRGKEMIITGAQARMRGMDVDRFSVYSGELGRKGGTVIEIKSELAGALNTKLDILRKSKLNGQPTQLSRYIHPQLEGEGAGDISLSITLPTGKTGRTKIRGAYSPRQAALKLPLLDFRMNNLVGSFEFDESGPYAGKLKGSFLGGQADMDIERMGTGSRATTRLRSSGDWKGQGLAKAFDYWLEPYIQGEGKWKGEVNWDQLGPKVDFWADTSQLNIDLPVPAGKRSDGKSSFILRTRSRSNQRQEMEMEIDNYLQGRLVFRNHDSNWRFFGGNVALGQRAPRPKTEGMAVHISSKFLDMDRWQLLYNDYQETHGKQADSPIRQLTGSFKQTVAFDRDFKSTRFSFIENKGKWSGRVAGERIDGKVVVDTAGQASKFFMDLHKLVFPKELVRESKEEFDFYQLPSVKLSARSLHYGKVDLGMVDTIFKPATNGWVLEKLAIKRPEMSLSASGRLDRRAGRHYGNFKLEVESDDMGASLKALDYGGQIKSGEMKLKSDFGWQGARQIDLKSMQAELKLKAKNGRILKVEQGAAKMLGFLNIGAIGRILTLDFGSLFGSGFAFDDINADGKIEKGVLLTRKTVIKGPTAELILSGKIDLDKEQYDMLMGVNPSLADSLAMGSWLSGAPQLGAAILLFKKLFGAKKKEVKSSTITYRVTGPWEKPLIKKIELDNKAKKESDKEKSERLDEDG